MLITEFLKSLKGCRHDKVSVTSNGMYCPDCGKYIIIKWYLVRCSCCGIKRVAYTDFNDNVKAVDKYCPNCGNIHTVVEVLDKINFVDINFAVHKKEVFEPQFKEFSTQIWAETTNEEQLLIGLN